MVMLFKLVSCPGQRSCECTTISEQTSWPEHAVLSQSFLREIGADSKAKACLAASSNQPCQIIIHIQCTPFLLLYHIYSLQKCMCDRHLIFSQKSNDDYSLQKSNRNLYNVQCIKIVFIQANNAENKYQLINYILNWLSFFTRNI